MRGVACLLTVAACGNHRPARDIDPLPESQEALPTWFGSDDVPARRIAGLLSDGDGPVAGTIHVRIQAPDATIWKGLDREVGADGRFDLGELRAGRYQLLATAPGKTSRVVDVDTRTASGSPTVYLFACTPTTSTILGDDGKPVPNAQVDVGGVVIATTDAAGSYSVCINRERTTLYARAPGYAVTPIWVSGQRIVNVRLAVSFRLHGCVLDPSRIPSAGVAVQPVEVDQVRPTHGGGDVALPIQATTDASGCFTLRGLASMEQPNLGALYYFRIIDHDSVLEDRAAIVNGASPIDVAITPRMPAQAVDGPWGADATVAGRVMHAGKPLPDALVQDIIINEGTFRSRTDPDGRFELRVRSGRVMLEVEHPTGLATERLVDVASGQRLDGVVIEVASMGRIEGVVVDGGNKPLAKVTIWVRAQDAPIMRYAYTESDGAFSVDLEVGHTYVLEAKDGETGAKAERELQLDGDASGLRVVLGGPRALEGVAIDESGAPVAGAAVISNQPTFQRLADGGSRSQSPWTPHGVRVRSLVASSLFVQEVKTDSSGRFAWAPIMDGAYSIMIAATDGRVGVADNVIASSSPLRITVHPPGSIHVVCDGFRPMDGTLKDMMGGVGIVAGQRRFDVACDETVGDMPEGHYLVTSKAGARRFASTTVEVRSDATVAATLKVLPAGTINGRALSYPDGKPIAGLECDAGILEGNGRTVRGDSGVQTSVDGTFELTISGGHIIVTCEDPRSQYADGQAEVDLSGTATVGVRMVGTPTDAVDLDVDFDATPDGAVLTAIGATAANAGLKIDDLVKSVDGASLSGLGKHAIRALAFTVMPKTAKTLVVVRDGAEVSVVVNPR